MVNNILLKISIIFWIGFSYCQLPFVIGEQLVYDVDFRIFSAGKTTLKIQPDSINGIEVYKITAITKTNSFLDRFYKVRDRVDAWVDTDKFNLLKVKKKIREKKYKSDFTAVININDSTAISKNKITKLPGNVLDPYTAIYYFHTLVLELGKKYQFYSYDNGKVKEIIIYKLGVEDKKITKEAKFIDDLGADSLDTVELIMQFEEEFGIEIPDEDAEGLVSVGLAVDYISTKLN